MTLSAILFVSATLNLALGYGLMPFSSSNLRGASRGKNILKRSFKIGGYSLLVLAIVYGVESI